MLFQLNPSSSMIINRARLTSAAGETRDRVNDTNARRSSLVRLKTDCMLHIVLLKSMLHNTSLQKFATNKIGFEGEKFYMDIAPINEKTGYVRWMKSQGLPIHIGHGMADLRTLEVAP